MEWLIWIPLIYLMGGITACWHDVRTTFKQNMKTLSQYRFYYPKGGHGQKERNHEEQVRAALDDSFKDLRFTFFLWPIYFFIASLGPVIDGIGWLVGGKEIRAARQEDEDAKTKELLARIEEEEKKKFDGL